MTDLQVTLPPSGHSYNIKISSGIGAERLKHHSETGGFTIVDKVVAELYRSILPNNRVYIFEASEDNKSLDSVSHILEWLRQEGALRDDSILAFGGGITGDTAGFAASVYMRGIKVIQMPTTLLSMVDSSVGGKTGVNFGGIKNNIGSFHQPTEVIIDIDFLNTLSDSEFLNGLAESLKIAAIADRDFFCFLRDNKDAVLSRDKEILEKIVSRSCQLKANIVEADEKESGVRKLLNFGHTVAHAIEADSFHRVTHGYAVAMGMAYETIYAFQNGFADKSVLNEITNILTLYGYNIMYTPANDKIFLNALCKDKKAGRDGISLALTGEGMTGKIINGVKPEAIGRLFF